MAPRCRSEQGKSFVFVRVVRFAHWDWPPAATSPSTQTLAPMTTHEYETAIDAFAKTAREFCAWAESPPLTPAAEHFTAARLVAKLYASALDLPVSAPTDAPDAPRVSDDAYRALHKRFGALPFQYYSEMFNPFEFEAAPVTGDIADDLADIYRDLKYGLWFYEHGHVPAAVWEWRTTFGFHWGRHATGALLALHCYDQEQNGL